ncbi:biotin--[acetyl-CoA-carboxylase] ligase [Sphingomonas colocasiae]|uniref:biotin--[biotin carboxyl-carrier protein] ligase n=1 Tax=Sphingomonas colocasiae TaxID=1848973 RepID=A0ABS7PNQ6_9SPHN|nr:biotin--[acetyl-CoA-carboxylase] ligase [Sphingomonas colocasiae]MBY8822956.1 biotin--[acetyl-CoA-carboxylase] ligase [Sphingomonas colocasiae]
MTVIRTVERTASTNQDMLALAGAGEAEGLWLRAVTQSAGRGRLGRSWSSPPGNLYVSTLVRPRASDPSVATLALVAAVALHEVLVAWSGSDALRIKWPNDILLDGAKLSGILLEGAGDAVVIGIGVNLAHHPEGLDRPVTSLAAHGAAPDPALFLDDLAAAFARWLARWRGEGLEPVRERWLAAAHARGTALTANLPDGESVEGLFDGLDAGGALILRLADGTSRAIHAGDVFLI